jgi:hypothetical protein
MNEDSWHRMKLGSVTGTYPRFCVCYGVFLDGWEGPHCNLARNGTELECESL